MNVRSLWQTWHQQLFGRAKLRRSRMPRRSAAGCQRSGHWAAQVQVLEDRTLLSSIVVNSVADSGPGTLRQAILDANAANGADEIDFQFTTPGVHTISPLSGLPEITDQVIINGYSQAGAQKNTFGIGPDTPGHALGDGDNAVLTIELDGSNAGSLANGLVLGAGNSTIEGLVINRFAGYGIFVSGLSTTSYSFNPAAGGNTIAGNFIGTDVTGTVALGNGMAPPFQVLNNTANAGILLASSPNNTVGGLTPDARNIISGNVGDGIVVQDSYVLGSTHTDGNQILGNLIGTDASGTLPLGNASNGIGVHYSATNTAIGGTTPGARNVISASLGTVTTWADNATSGAGIFEAATAASIQGNFIGTDVTGTKSLGNSYVGIAIRAAGATIGGTAPGAGNLISGNGSYGGIAVVGSTDVQVQGNFIGTDVTGTVALSGQSGGIIVQFSDNVLIGGTAPGARNLISGNLFAGIDLRDSNNIVQGNFIGTDVTGKFDLGGGGGINLADAATNNLIGGTAPEAGNLIAGYGVGIALSSAGTHGNTIQGNRIGTDVTGSVAIAGSSVGIELFAGASANIIGGIGLGEANIIRSRDIGALLFDDSVGNSMRGNLFGATVTRPIVLFGGAWTTAPNDPLDADTGPNDLQNHPVITNAVVGTATHVSGVLDSFANGTFAVDFYAGTSLNQTLRYIGTTTVSTDAAGHAVFDLPLAATTAANETIFATATNVAGSTSEVSPAAAQVFVGVSDITQAHKINAVEGNNTGSVVLATFLDVNSAAQASDFTVGVNWGGSLIGTPTVAVQFVSQTAGVSTWQVVGSATYAEASLNHVTVSVSDVRGGNFSSSQTTTSVADAPLSDTTVAATLNATAGVSTGSIVLATFTDGNPYASVSDYTATVDFGGPVSGTPTASIQFVSSTGGVSTWKVVGNVMYASAGSYTVTVAVNDAEGAGMTTNKTHVAVAAASHVSILLLDASGQGALSDSGNGKIIVGGKGEIVVASRNSGAIVVNGNGSVTAYEIDVESSTGTQVSGNGKINGVVDRGVSSSEAVDPLAGLAVPTAPTTQFAATSIAGSSVVTLQPGTYNGGIQISGNAHVTMAPGIYYLNGGGFSVTGNAVVTGTGVFIYNAAQSANDTITISGNASVNLSAQTSGIYKGVVLFQARTATAQIYISGNAALVVTGTLYAPKAKINVSGNGLLQLVGADSELIAADLIVSGNGIVKVND